MSPPRQWFFLMEYELGFISLQPSHYFLELSIVLGLLGDVQKETARLSSWAFREWSSYIYGQDATVFLSHDDCLHTIWTLNQGNMERLNTESFYKASITACQAESQCQNAILLALVQDSKTQTAGALNGWAPNSMQSSSPRTPTTWLLSQTSIDASMNTHRGLDSSQKEEC